MFIFNDLFSFNNFLLMIRFSFYIIFIDVDDINYIMFIIIYVIMFLVIVGLIVIDFRK
jgi:hypothetical protein